MAIAYAVAVLVVAGVSATGMHPGSDPERAGGGPPTSAPEVLDAAPDAGPVRPAPPVEQPTPPAGDDAGSVPAPPPPPRTSARFSDVVTERGPDPSGLRIPALGIDAPVIPVGQRDGTLDVPDDVVNVAWYEHGPTPGDVGSAVLAAHVDLARQGPGVFFRLGEARPGDLVEVVREDGSVVSFFVERIERHAKEELPVDELFARDGVPRLALITCGGAFDASQGRYADNVVAIAAPLD